MNLHVQSKTHRFGKVLLGEFSDPDLVSADIAVAWVRASGLLHLQQAILNLLGSGGKLRIIVGIDGDNTSVEGLEGLLALQAVKPSHVTLYVRHNEAGPLFHPKVYLFRHAAAIRAYVGSNNLTQSGLFQNDEVSILVPFKPKDPLDKQFSDYFADLIADTALTKPLDSTLLQELVNRNYVQNEAALRATASARGKRGKKTTALFGSVAMSPPKPPSGSSGPVTATGIAPTPSASHAGWQNVFLRVRLARGTQAQIPIAVAREIRRRVGLVPEDGSIPIRSIADNTPKQINPARARGQVNTYKFEGVSAKGEPLLHIMLIGNDLFYQFLDSNNTLGKPVLKLLNDGFNSDPPETYASKTDHKNATWWRYT